MSAIFSSPVLCIYDESKIPYLLRELKKSTTPFLHCYGQTIIMKCTIAHFSDHIVTLTHPQHLILMLKIDAQYKDHMSYFRSTFHCRFEYKAWRTLTDKLQHNNCVMEKMRTAYMRIRGSPSFSFALLSVHLESLLGFFSLFFVFL